MLFNYVNNNKIAVNINDKDENNSYFLLKAVDINSNNTVRSLFHHARLFNIILNINDQDVYGNYPISKAVENNNVEMVSLLLYYATRNNIILDIKHKELNGMYILLKAVINDNIYIVQLLLDYANENNIFIDINDIDVNGRYPLLMASNNNDMVQLLIDYAIKNKIFLKKLNDSFFTFVEKDNVEMVKLLMDYAEKNNFVFFINDKNKNGSFPFLEAVKNNNMDMVKLLMDYSNKNDASLNIYDMNNDGEDLIFQAISHSNIEMTKLLINFINKNHIILNNAENSLVKATEVNNKEMVELMIDYANKNHIILNINYKFEDGRYSMLIAVKNNNKDIIEILMDYAHKNGIILNIGDIDKNGENSLLNAFLCKNNEMVKLLIDYANKNNIDLSLHEKNREGLSSFLLSMKDYEMFKLLMDYATKNNIRLYINDINNYGDYPLLYATTENNIEICKLLVSYANNNNIILSINETNYNRNYPLIEAIYHDNYEMVKLLMDYANNNDIILNINEEDMYENYPISASVYNNNNEMVKLLIDYANENNIFMNDIGYSFFKAIENNNLEIVTLLVEYAKRNDILLNINGCNEGKYPLLMSIDNENIVMAKLLIAYANEYNIILKINVKDINQYYPLLEAIKKNDDEMVKILIDYANNNNINLNVNDKDSDGNYPLRLVSIYNNIEMAKQLKIYADEHRIKLKYHHNDLSNEILNIINDKAFKKRRERENFEYELRKKIELEILKKYGLDKGNRRNLIDVDFLNNSESTSNLVIATNDFIAEEYDQLDIKKDDFLIVTDWYCKEGWVSGYRKENPNEKGLFPKIFIKIYNEDIIEKSTLKFEITPQQKVHFENKVKQLQSQQEMKLRESFIEIPIHRDNIFKDAFENIMKHSPEELKKRLRIKYENEEGIDAGGLLRDFFYQISKEIGNPNYSLFQYPSDQSYELEINPKSGTFEPDHLKYFRFIGRLLGLAIFHKQYLSVHFILIFYKKLLNKSLEYSDLEIIDPEIYKNMKWLKENDGAENLCLTFELDTVDCFGNHKKVELKPNGASIDVTDDNKNEYIDLVVKHKLNNSNDKEQFKAIEYGFYEIIPKYINSIFNEFELKLLISGINEIDVDDWENNTCYEGYTENDITIINFWKCVREFKPDKQIKLLVFATGNSQVPVTGFKDLQGGGRIQHFKLKKIGNPNDLPKSHTCFNRIDLPPYTSYIQLKQKLLLAISEGMGGFAME